MGRVVYTSDLEPETKVMGLSFSAFLLGLALVCLYVRSSVSVLEFDLANALWQLSLGVYVMSITNLHHTALFRD